MEIERDDLREMLAKAAAISGDKEYRRRYDFDEQDRHRIPPLKRDYEIADWVIQNHA